MLSLFAPPMSLLMTEPALLLWRAVNAELWASISAATGTKYTQVNMYQRNKPEPKQAKIYYNAFSQKWLLCMPLIRRTRQKDLPIDFVLLTHGNLKQLLYWIRHQRLNLKAYAMWTVELWSNQELTAGACHMLFWPHEMQDWFWHALN